MEDNKRFRNAVTAALLSTGRQWRRAVNMRLEPYGVTDSSSSLLLWIAKIGGGVRQVALAQHARVEPATLVRSLDRLEELALIVRKPDPADRRSNTLWLTDEGSALVTTVEHILDELRGKALGGVAETDLEAASRVLCSFEALEF